MASRQGKNRAAVSEEDKIAELEAEVAATEWLEDIDMDDEPLEPPGSEISNATKLKNIWIKVKDLERLWIKAREKAESETKAFQDERASLEVEKTALTERLDQLASREADLAKAELELEQHRSDARAGFASELRTLTAEAAKRRDEILAEAARLEDDARVRTNAVVSDAQEALDTERADLAAERAQLRHDESALRQRESQMEDDLAFAQKKVTMLKEQFENRLKIQVAHSNEQLDEQRAILELERKRQSEREDELRRLRAELARYGADPDAAKHRNDELVRQVNELRDELSRRPPADDVAELREKAKSLVEAQDEASHWRQRHDQIDRQLRYQLTNVGELEVLRDERDALAAQRETLRQAITQQRTDWEELQAKEGSKEPFPACSAYDRDSALSQPADTRGFDSLAGLVSEVRHRMATDSTTPFYYSESDVRLFLAGLASSRLHLLQGISGTGKTSLPREFFKALNSGEPGSAQIVEVQAGWRDKDDLFGFYNAFEKRFAESEFTKALYRALLPANADRPMVIVLDEMNLAHPEQYFGTMLSVLENAVTEVGYVDLLTSEIPGLPEQFDGSRLPLPRNVWFVGTANHDETTVAFADKTYDRAHVQELPSRHEVFDARRQGVDDPISFQDLQAAFATASQDLREEVKLVRTFLNGKLHDQFGRFGVGWGNRLERQLERFVPVIVQAGGSLTEAVDHLVSTKLARKLEDRFGVSPDDLGELADNLEMIWDLDGESPTKTTERIRREANRLRGGYGS
ncbi:AAA family ATPase [Mycolicibacterium sp. XJ870]